jgi:hypothetical protein
MAAEEGIGALRGDDAGALLAAVLEGEEAVIGKEGGVRMAEDAEDAALVTGNVGTVQEEVADWVAERGSLRGAGRFAMIGEGVIFGWKM